MMAQQFHLSSIFGLGATAIFFYFLGSISRSDPPTGGHELNRQVGSGELRATAHPCSHPNVVPANSCPAFPSPSICPDQKCPICPREAPALCPSQAALVNHPVYLDTALIDEVQPVLDVQRCTPPAGWKPKTFMEIVQGLITHKAPTLAYEIALKQGKNLNSPHVYHTMYQRWFAPLRLTKVRMLEIGIGCDMPLGPGGSIPLWREYMPCAQLNMFEYDGKCAEKFRDRLDGLYIGDQSNTAHLQKALDSGTFHIMIDDGGHSMNQQITSLRYLFPHLPAGGVYVLEDLSTSFAPPYFDIPGEQTTIKFISDVLAHLHWRNNGRNVVNAMDGSKELAELVLSVDCIREACVFIRK